MPANLVARLRKKRSLARAWRVILNNARSSRSRDTRREIDEFALDADAHLDRIQRQLNQCKFKFHPARGIPIPKKDGKSVRPIVVAPIETRIVQRAVHDVLLTVPRIKALSSNPFSFGGVQKSQGETLAAVPAAIEAVLKSIGEGATFVIRSDISAFFTKIPKPTVIQMVADAVDDAEFVRIFQQAIAVELENLAALGIHAADFPLEDIGVAQGSSLSPLLGNLLLHEFDEQMNSGECRTIRYIDDFLILAHDPTTAERWFSRASQLLSKHGLKTAKDKTFRGLIQKGFEFLGIEIGNGRITPSKASRSKLLEKVRDALNITGQELREQATGQISDSSFTMIRTLLEVSGIVNGWGHHYSFCNEKHVFSQLDGKLDEMLREYFRKYSAARKLADSKGARRLLGVPLLEELASRPFDWPKLGANGKA